MNASERISMYYLYIYTKATEGTQASAASAWLQVPVVVSNLINFKKTKGKKEMFALGIF